ncbi:DUF2513 domain-containing protein [Latilactobacillus sp. 5-91]|uniref:DUF2513 domain-containing protein n=1 Tax=Latilactobacillus sp. 5-91 TaxID=3410924 RepID=UPI003C77BA95
MKLNHDCVRDVLLEIESFPLRDFPLQLADLKKTPDQYSLEDTVYSLQQLMDAGYITGTCKMDFAGNYMLIIRTITWEGNKFLDNICNPKIWSETTTTVAKKVGNASLNILSSVASKLITSSLGL